jgi:hypothetical protein
VFAPMMFHALETIGFYFSLNSAEVVIATRSDGDERTEHPWCLRRLMRTQNVRSISDEPCKIDLLIADAAVGPLLTC